MKSSLRTVFLVATLGLLIHYTTGVVREAVADTATSTVAGAIGADGDAAVAREALESNIREKSSELEKLNAELNAKQAALQNTKTERTTLQRELSKLEQQIANLKLGIKTDELTAQKLGLEIDSLGYDIRDIERSTEAKLSAIGKLLGELYQRDRANPLIVFIKSADIGEAIAETHAIKNVKTQLRDDVAGLTILKEHLREKLASVNRKKNEAELSKKNQIARKAIAEDKTEERRVVLVETKNKESVYEQQVAELKKQQETLEDQIDAAEAKLRAAFDPSLAPSKRGGLFLWPVKLTDEGGAGRITQHFGERSYLYRGKPHNGLDVGVPIGTPVFAAEDGTVTTADNNDRTARLKYQYGKYILVKHPNNLSTLYAHLSRQLVHAGDSVKRGDLIGYSGSTGYATGAHVHFGVYWSASIEMKSIPPASGLVPIGVTLNPEDYL